MTAMTPSDPGYGRDQALEKTRGTGRPADADLDPHSLDVDPNPERHIHFSPDVAEEETGPTPSDLHASERPGAAFGR